jgi:hypothetical protein
MRRTHLLGLALAAAASAALPAVATAAPRADRPAPPRFAIDIGTSESLQPAAPSGIIAILIGLQQAPPPPSFSGDAYVNEMG